MIKVVDINSKEMARELKRFSRHLDSHSKNESKRALASVINKNLGMIKTKIVRKVSTTTQIPQKAIRPRVRIVKARANNLGATVWVGLNRITASSAGAKKTEDGYRVGPYSWPGAFTIKKFKGAIFQRTSTGRFPLRTAAFGEGFTSGVLKRATNSVISSNLDNDLRAKLMREMSFRLDRIMKKK